ncbi:MAG: type I methionyl aminopeptidase [Bdellovibrionaceae bacterium]|nr:type I methionyl aminopeptidase [Pseudobdellovibrionaceae bacterium]
MSVENESQFEGLKAIGQIVANCLVTMRAAAEVGMTTAELDHIGESYLQHHGALSAPRSVYDFPGATCISVEFAGVHGVPGSQVLQAGHLINIDVSAQKNGFFADTGGSFVLGRGTSIKENLCLSTKRALSLALKHVSDGRELSEMGRQVEKHARRSGLTVVRNVGGHGVGRNLHESPEFIANFYQKNERRRFKQNQVVAIEPILSTGAQILEEMDDGWTLYHPRHYTAQFEHTVMVTKGRPVILTQPTISAS